MALLAKAVTTCMTTSLTAAPLSAPSELPIFLMLIEGNRDGDLLIETRQAGTDDHRCVGDIELLDHDADGLILRAVAPRWREVGGGVFLGC